MYFEKNEYIMEINTQYQEVKVNHNYITLEFSNVSKHQISISIPNFTISIYELKKIISKKFDYSSEQLLLYYNYNTIDDCKTLLDYNMTHKSVINVILKEDCYVINIC